MPNFLYPHIVQVRRPAVAASGGDSGYFGLESATETVIAQNIPANIDNAGRAATGLGIASVPSDASKSTWRIFTPRNALPPGAIRVRDIIVDEFGQRYQASAVQNHPLGMTMLAELLTA
jgi:hypothetical protein